MTNSLIENWTNYSMRLRKTPNPDFSKIRNLSSEFITKLPQEAQDELFSQMNRGELPLGSEPEMSMYMFAYGKMHYEKLLRAFEQIPKTFFENEIEIIDYGCGQAMGLIAYADYIKQRGYNQKISNITLIEPSKLTIGRAILHANQIFPNVTVNAICKSLDDLDDADIQTDANTQKLHLFSNIIDVELFSLDQLSEYIKLRFDGNNQFICVSPFFGSTSSRANRLDEFMNLMATSGFYSENLGKNDWINGWTCSIRVFANNAQNADSDSNSDTVTDIDGNVYKTVQIGNQIWMAENLRVSRYRNGDLIPNVTDDIDWENLKIGAWCNYDDDTDYDFEYGKLYNWYAVDDNRGLAPEGWHVPTYNDWYILVKLLGGEFVASGKLKQTGTVNWRSPNSYATNETGFSALPCGSRGAFNNDGVCGFWWSATEKNSKDAWYREMHCYNGYIHRSSIDKVNGFSIRCIKNIEHEEVVILNQKSIDLRQKSEIMNDLNDIQNDSVYEKNLKLDNLILIKKEVTANPKYTKMFFKGVCYLPEQEPLCCTDVILGNKNGMNSLVYTVSQNSKTEISDKFSIGKVFESFAIQIIDCSDPIFDGQAARIDNNGNPYLDKSKQPIYRCTRLVTKVELASEGHKLIEVIKTPSLRDEIQTVFIPAGTFIMGSPINEIDREKDEIQHQVTLSSFIMSKYAITNEQFAAFLNAKCIDCNGINGTYNNQILIDCSISLYNWGLRCWGSKWIPVGGYENYPVINVSWYGACEFAKFVGGALPTEAQWEYACRAGTSTPFNTGKFLSFLQANYDWKYPYNRGKNKLTTGIMNTESVGSYKANAFGLYNMHGNVWEWCFDWYGIFPTSEQTNPLGAVSGSHRVIRGGGWNSKALECRSAFRSYYSPSSNHISIGFRVVFPLEVKK